MNLGVFLLIGGIVIIAGLYLWARQRQSLGYIPPVDAPTSFSTSPDDGDNAIIVARQHGQIVHINPRAMEWLGLDGADLNLEQVASHVKPADSFLDLFARQGQASFQIGSRWVEGASHLIPGSVEQRMVIVMRELGGAGSATATASASLDLRRVMQITDEIGETVNASMSSQQALQALLTIIRKAIPASAGEISIWHEETRTLTPDSWVGEGSYLVSLAERGGVYQYGEGISGWIARHRRPVLVSDVSDPTAIQPKFSSQFHSFVGVPLELGERLLGTLELADTQAGRFQQTDLALLQAISKQVAIAIFNADLYSQQAQRISDMANLQNVQLDEENAHDPRAVFAVLSQRLATLSHARIAGILLYDEARRALVPQAPFHGLPEQLIPRLAFSLTDGSDPLDIWENRPYWHTNEVPEVEWLNQAGLAGTLASAGIRSLALLPLEVGSRRIGMAFIANRQPGGFNNQDIKDMRLLVAQAAIVVQNIRLFQREARQDAELAGLQEITQAIGSLRQTEGEFYSDINGRIARLMDVQVCGILLYDEASSRLRPQIPFFGVADTDLNGYGIDLLPDSPMTALWDEGETWFANRVEENAIVHASNLAEVAARLGFKQMMLAPLAVGGRKLGVVQVSNRLTGEDFTDKDGQLLQIFATQAAAIIENARLVQDVQRSADQSNRLRNIAELSGKILTTEDSFALILNEISTLLDSPIVFINQLETQTGALVTYPRYVFGAALAEPIRQDIFSPGFEYSVVFSQNSFFSNSVLKDQRVLESYLDIARQMGINRAVIVPLIVGDRSLGELGVANRPDDPYTEADVELMEAVAAQIGATIERLQLYEASGANLSRRVQELDAISAVTNELTRTLDLDSVLERIREHSIRATRADGGTVILLKSLSALEDPHQPEARQRYGLEDQGLNMADIERSAFFAGSETVTVFNYATSNLKPLPPQAESALAVAFFYEDQIVGVLHLYHHEPNHFDDRAASFLLTMAAKASLGYGNYVRYQEQLESNSRLRRRAEQIKQIFEMGQMIQTNTSLEDMLEGTLYNIQIGTGYDLGVALVLDETTNTFSRLAQMGMPLEAFERSRYNTISLQDLLTLMRRDYAMSESFFFPAESRADWATVDIKALEVGSAGIRPMPEPTTPADWHPGDLLLVPLNGAGGNLIGLLTLEQPQDHRRPDNAAIELLEIFAHQAAGSLENLRLYQQTQQNAEQEARLNEMVETISGTLVASEIIDGLVQTVVKVLPISRLTVALEDSERQGMEITRLRILTDGTIVTNQEHQSYPEGTALYQAFRSGQHVLYTADSPEIEDLSDLRSLYFQYGERASLLIPLFSAEGPLGALHMGSDHDSAALFEENRSLLVRMAKLAAVAIDNARLFNQAMNLQTFNQSVVQSIQQGIVVLDNSGRILSINDFMRQRYGWVTRDALRQDLFVYSPELDFLKTDLQSVLEQGEPVERIRQITSDGSGASLVRNFYSYPLKTAETIRGAVILVEDNTERYELEQDVERRANQLAALTEISSRITATLDRADVVKLALEEMAKLVTFDSLTLWTRVDQDLYLEGARVGGATIDLQPHDRKRLRLSGHPRMREVVDTGRVFRINNLLGTDSLPFETNAKSWMGVPLLDRGAVVGVIALAKDSPRFFDNQSEVAASNFGNQVAIALANASLFEEAQYRTERLSLINRVSVALAQSLDSENILEIGLKEIGQSLDMHHAQAWIFDRDANVARAIVTLPRGDAPPDEVIPLRDSSLFMRLRASSQPIIVEDVTRLEQDDPVSGALTGRELHAFALIPMIVGGQVIGAFELMDDNLSRQFRPEQIELALIIANQAAIAVQNTNLFEQTLIRSRELETLLEAAQATALTRDLPEAFSRVTDLILNALEMDTCSVMLWDNVEDVLEVALDVSRYGATNGTPATQRLSLQQYPLRRRSMDEREIVVVRVENPLSDATEVAGMRERGEALRLLLPLVTRDQPIGMIVSALKRPNPAFGHREVRLAQALGAQAAIAIQNARLSTQTAALVEQSFYINNLAQSISSALSIDDIVEIVREQVPRLIDAAEMYLGLYDPKSHNIFFPMATRGETEFHLPQRSLGNDEASFIIKKRRSLSLGSGNVDADDLRSNLGIVSAENNARSYLGVPIVAGDQVMGVLAVRDLQNPRRFGINDERLLMTVGTQLGVAIQNARLFEQVRGFAAELNLRVEERTTELQTERDRLDTLYQITSELTRSLDMERVLNRALGMIVSAVSADDGVIMLLDPMSDSLLTRAALHPVGVGQVHPAQSIANYMLMTDTGDPLLLADHLETQPYWDNTIPGADAFHSALAVLLESGDDPQGVLVLLSSRTRLFTDPQVKLVNAAANQVAAAINNADLYQLIREQAESLGKLLRTEQEEAEKNSAIVEGIADGIMLADADGVIIQFNSAAERMLELDRDEVVGQALFKLTGIFGASASRWADAVARWSAQPEAQPAGFFLEEKLDLGRRIVNVHLSPVSIGEQFLGTVSVFRDVTKEVEVDRIKSEFVSNVSHELRTPMTSIKGYADLLLMGVAGQLPDAQKGFLEKIKSNADRLSHLVDDLLNISKIDSGEQMSLEMLDLREVINSIIQQHEQIADHAKKNMRVRIDVEPGLPLIPADPHHLKQILDNIIDNAYNYSYADGLISIDAKVERPAGDRVIISVKDTGIGIPENFKERIWGRFERYDENALVMDVAGTGLGLSIVKELVRLHNGEVWFESEFGHGSTFYIALPINQPQQAM
ncbi:MAG TPA: GAF domain-containing protein [Aggregatilineales bacterium]|nr:GAF domain-containing protein [Aggregatilineales bacterium]